MFDGFERECLRLIPLQNMRPYLRFGKLSNRFSKLDLLLCIRKVHRGSVFLDGMRGSHLLPVYQCGAAAFDRSPVGWGSTRVSMNRRAGTEWCLDVERRDQGTVKLV